MVGEGTPTTRSAGSQAVDATTLAVTPFGTQFSAKSHTASGRSRYVQGPCLRHAASAFATLETLWYLLMMQPETLSAQPAAARLPTSPARSLAAVHAAALYRPVPPFACDDDGYLHDDSAMSENTYHAWLRTYFLATLHARYRDRGDVYVATDLAVHFEEGNRAAVVSPDLMVVFGAPVHHRLSYKLWEEPKTPDLVAEVLSEKTWRRDLTVKSALYQDLGVREFWVLDVIGKLPAPVMGMRLNSNRMYEPIPPSPDGALASELLGCELLDNDRNFRFRDLATGELVPDYTESEQMRVTAEAEANAAREVADAAREEAAAARERIRELEERLRAQRST